MEVRKALPSDWLPKIQIGLDKTIKDVENKLGSANVIGLVGMVGIGKTTLAMELYNRWNKSRYGLILRDVQSNQTSVLRTKILQKLGLKFKWHSNDEEYRRTLHIALKHRRMLFIVDDISDANQFEALFPEIHMILEMGCIFVITSRQHNVLQHVMSAMPVTSKVVYEVQRLDEFDSRCLFNMHAFMSKTPVEGFVEFATTIADACRGHPFLLETMGRHLFDNETLEDKEIWSETAKMVHVNNMCLEVRLLSLKL